MDERLGELCEEVAQKPAVEIKRTIKQLRQARDVLLNVLEARRRYEVEADRAAKDRCIVSCSSSGSDSSKAINDDSKRKK